MAREREDTGKSSRPRFVERDTEGKFKEVDSDGRDWQENQAGAPNGEVDRDDFDDGIEPKR